MDINRLIDAGFDAVKGYVDRGFAGVLVRLAALEQRTPERGERGEPGLVGPPGEKGETGRDADMMVSPELADQVASAVRVLHEAPPIVELSAPATAKVIRIERDENGALVPVYE